MKLSCGNENAVSNGHSRTNRYVCIELNIRAAALNQIEQRLEIRRQCGGELQTLMRGWLSEAKLGRMQKLPTEFCY